MSFKLKLKEWEIALLEWNLANLREESVHVSKTRKWTSTGLGPEAYAEEQRYWARKKLKWDRRKLQHKIAYLKRQHYLERSEENEQLLNKLTARGAFEVLRLQFILHMYHKRKKAWGQKYYLAIFDIPEDKRRFRDFFRKLLSQNGFIMLQRSVWITRYNPRPAIDALLKYLKLEKYFELMEINCEQCSLHLRRKVK